MREQPGYLFLVESDTVFWEMKLKFAEPQSKTVHFKGKLPPVSSTAPQVKGYFKKQMFKNANTQPEFKHNQS